MTLRTAPAPLLVIAGPTGSGKSELALHLAETFSGEIVNCDSLQLYRGFDIGTAKPPPEALRRVPHHLFDVLDPAMVYSAGDYSKQARSVVAEIAARGRLPLVTGGTGFYLRALIDGLPKLPPRDEALRERLAERERRRPGSLHRLLSRLEPEAAARIHARDTQKLVRALEVRLLTRQAFPEPAAADPLPGFRILQIGLAPERERLRASIARRTKAMFEAGLADEVRALLAGGLRGTEKPFEALGYKQVLRYLQNRTTLEEAVASTILETGQYAKRQSTWFRRDPRIRWLEGMGGEPEIQRQAAAWTRGFLHAPQEPAAGNPSDPSGLID